MVASGRSLHHQPTKTKTETNPMTTFPGAAAEPLRGPGTAHGGIRARYRDGRRGAWRQPCVTGPFTRRAHFMLQPTRTKVGPRGRVTVPVAVQRAVGLTEGDEVIIRAVSPGVVVVETPQAIKDRIRAGIPATAETENFDAVADIRALRDTENDRIDHLSPPQEPLDQPASGAGPPL